MARQMRLSSRPFGGLPWTRAGRNTIRQRIDVFSFLTTRAERREGLSEVNIRGTKHHCSALAVGWVEEIIFVVLLRDTF